ncbi:MAG: Os1348 family NHLP clan protein [Thermodesulfobacteriota bacterium]
MGESSEQETSRDPEGPASSKSGAPTIVGGRPGEESRGSGGIPVGIQVLVKKAAVDEDFRAALLETRAQAASRIGLELTPAEVATLGSVPREQLEKIIEHTKVPNEQRRVFLGQLGAAMAALLVSPVKALAEYRSPEPITGERPDRPGVRGVRPDLPPGRPRPEERDPRTESENPPAVRTETGREHLRCRVLRQHADSVKLSVSYHCPYESADLTALFLPAPGEDEEEFRWYRAASTVLLSKGSGNVEIEVRARGGKTEWLVIIMSDMSGMCVRSPAWWNEFRDSEPGEYTVMGCAVWRTIKYPKQWSARERQSLP